MSILFVTYGSAWADPPQRQSLLALAEQFGRVFLFEGETDDNAKWSEFKGIEVCKCEAPKQRGIKLARFHRMMRFIIFRARLKQCIQRIKPDAIVTYMFNSLAALPASAIRRPHCSLISMILDIPSPRDSGMIDRIAVKLAWRRLRAANVVWASDAYKAELVGIRGRLKRPPMVCYNCPRLDYLPEPTWPRDPWLRTELIQRGARIGLEGGSILLRAGAVGSCGGIEATLQIMANLPDDYIFVMLGRPPADYKMTVENLIDRFGLRRRAFLWDRPSDEVWKKALQGADIGHLIHGPFRPGRMARIFNLNSSLSNNRLFQYMAAGLPIISYDDTRMSDLHDEVPCFRVVRVANLGGDIRQHWQGLASNNATRRRLGDAGRRAHLDKYNWEAQFAPVLNAISVSSAQEIGTRQSPLASRSS